MVNSVPTFWDNLSVRSYNSTLGDIRKYSKPEHDKVYSHIPPASVRSYIPCINVCSLAKKYSLSHYQCYYIRRAHSIFLTRHASYIITITD